MSTHSTRCPASASATARLRVVVVLATPPFWLANAITWLMSTAVFAPGQRNPPRATPLFSGSVPSLLDKRLLFVTGKGGIGKSTVATALGLLASRRGQRTIVAELASQ